MGRPRKNPEGETSPSTVVKKTTPSGRPTQREKDLETQVQNLTKMVSELMLSQQEKKETKPTLATKVEEYVNKDSVDELMKVESYYDSNSEPEDIPFKQYIKVMSLTNNKLSLSTEMHGRGTVYNFTNFGQVQSIFYDDLAKIIHNNDKFTKEGYFYILDPRVLRVHNLVEEYRKIPGKNTIENILNYSTQEIEQIMNRSTKHVRITIASLILEKMLSGTSVDLNKVRMISNISGADVEEIMKKIKENTGIA